MAETTQLVQGFVNWCDLLGITINLPKTQVWCNRAGSAQQSVRITLREGELALPLGATFRVVRVELGACDRVASSVHFGSRVETALETGRRLQQLPVPAPLASLLWRTVVLPKALYGCELRSLPSPLLCALTRQCRDIVPVKAPLQLCHYRSAEVICGPPLGACAVRDPMHEMLVGRARWLLILGNEASLVGTVHRYLAAPNGDLWREPSPALSHALTWLGWRPVLNLASPRARRWPHLDPEPFFLGTVSFQPLEDALPRHSAATDGSVCQWGGAALWQPGTRERLLLRLLEPQSSTQCELVALLLTLRPAQRPPRVLVDSLLSLQLIASWGQRSTVAILQCPVRVEVRTLLYRWQAAHYAPLLEKVKAHDSNAIARRCPKAMCNDAVDALAKEAATSPVVACYTPDQTMADVFQLHEASGRCVVEAPEAVSAVWWRNRLNSTKRTWLPQL